MRVYASFDPFPAPKGAATHISAFVEVLTRAYGPFDLVTVAPTPGTVADESALLQQVNHVPIAVSGKTLIDRVLAFRRELLGWWDGRCASVAHVRSIFEGYPLAREKGVLCKRLVYEVNALPSIELKYHYPDVADDIDLMTKLQAQERCCLAAADLILTPSAVTSEMLVARGVTAEKIRVVPNGVHLARFPYAAPRPWGREGPKLLYAGTLTVWQGVLVAIEALALYRRDFPATLTIVGPGRKRQRHAILERAYALGVTEHLELLPACSHQDLLRLHHECDVILAPLIPNDRNMIQGCCPLKVIEAMAAGTPLIASDLRVVSVLARDGIDAVLVRPGSAKAIKDGLLRLREDPGLGLRLSASARERVEREFTWERAGEGLLAAYEEVLNFSPSAG